MTTMKNIRWLAVLVIVNLAIILAFALLRRPAQPGPVAVPTEPGAAAVAKAPPPEATADRLRAAMERATQSAPYGYFESGQPITALDIVRGRGAFSGPVRPQIPFADTLKLIKGLTDETERGNALDRMMSDLVQSNATELIQFLNVSTPNLLPVYVSCARSLLCLDPQNFEKWVSQVPAGDQRRWFIEGAISVAASGPDSLGLTSWCAKLADPAERLLAAKVFIRDLYQRDPDRVTFSPHSAGPGG